MVEDVAEVAAQPPDVEREGTRERDLLADREQQLDVHGRALAADVSREREQHRHGRLVVGAEDPLVRVLPATLDEHRLDRRQRRNRVEVGAQQHRAGRVGLGPLIAGALAGSRWPRGMRASRLPQSAPVSAAASSS